MMRLTEFDRARVVEAIRQAETRTSGEIYCVLTRASSGYRVFPLAWSAVVAMLVPFPLIYLTAMSAALIYCLQLAAFFAFYVLLTREPIRYWIVPRATKNARAHQEALRQFGAHGLQHTALRTGVLIFVSAGERYAEVLADAGIDQKVAHDTWNNVVKTLTREIADNRPADGFVHAVERCADILAEHFQPGAINRDELPNAIVELWPLSGDHTTI